MIARILYRTHVKLLRRGAGCLDPAKNSECLFNSDERLNGADRPLSIHYLPVSRFLRRLRLCGFP
jgi:hypothetical protein